MPLVSLIVRTKDRPRLLKRALQSIASQTYRPIEVVLVNDGGCDLDIPEIKTLLGDVSLNYQRLEKNAGRAYAGNVGIANATGEYIGFLDDDDVLHNNHVAVSAGFLNHSDAFASYTDAVIVKNKASQDGYQPVSREITYTRDFDKDLILFQNYIPLLCLMFKRELLLKESFDTSFDLFEDWDLLIRLSRHRVFHRIPEVTAEYHLRDDNTVVELHPETFSHIEARYRVYRKHMGLLSERSLFIFESLHAEGEHYKGMYRGREEELANASAYIKEKEEELANASAYIREKENELAKASAYIGQIEEKKGKAATDIRESIQLKNAAANIEGMITIIILTFNGERYIKDLLDSLFIQVIDQPMEVIIIDSSSEDSTCKIAERYDVKVHVIDRADFSHPVTRNLGISLSKGQYIVFITQDATPMNEYWLQELLRPFGRCKNLAASYSRQIPRPDCAPLEARDIYIGAPCVDEIRAADLGFEWQKNDYLGNIHRYIRFSNVSACYLGTLLRNNLFDERLMMVEDQEWSMRMIEKGYSVYYASKSVVAHSHNFGVRQIYRRHFEYGSSFSKFLDHNPPKRIHAVKATLHDFVSDVLHILNDRRRWRSKLKWICMSPIHRFAANYGLSKGWRCG